MVVVLTPGQWHEQPVLPLLMERGTINRPGRYLEGRRLGAVIPTRTDEASDPAFDRAAYRERNVVERQIHRLKQFRRITTRDEKRAANYHAMLTVACVRLWL